MSSQSTCSKAESNAELDLSVHLNFPDDHYWQDYQSGIGKDAETTRVRPKSILPQFSREKLSDRPRIDKLTLSIHSLPIVLQGSGMLHWKATTNAEVQAQRRIVRPKARAILRCNLTGEMVRSSRRTDSLAKQRFPIKSRSEA